MMLIAGCASSPQTSVAAAPRIELPELATRPCHLQRLPPTPSVADLETGYVQRGADVVACDLARRLAVDTFQAQQRLAESALKPKRSRFSLFGRDD